MKDLMQLVDDYAEARVNYGHTTGITNVQQARQRVADYIESIGAGGVQSFAAEDMATAAAQGFRDGANADTERLQFMFDCVVAGRDPYAGDVTALIDKEYPNQSDIKTFDDFRRIVDICRGLP